jgi:hypothetical protein
MTYLSRSFETWEAAIFYASIAARRTRRRQRIRQEPSSVWGLVWSVEAL